MRTTTAPPFAIYGAIGRLTRLRLIAARADFDRAERAGDRGALDRWCERWDAIITDCERVGVGRWEAAGNDVDLIPPPF